MFVSLWDEQKIGGAKNHSPLLPTRQTTKIIAI